MRTRNVRNNYIIFVLNFYLFIYLFDLDYFFRSPTNDTVEPNTEKTDGNNFNNSISAKSSFESSSDDSSDSVSPEVPSTNPSKDDQTVSASTVIISSKDERVPI